MQLALQKQLAPQVVVDHGRRVVAKAWPTGIVPVCGSVLPSACRSSSCSWDTSSSMAPYQTIGIDVDFCCELVSACTGCRRKQDIPILPVEVGR